MQKFRTSDGFEFETTREPGRLRSVCRHGVDGAEIHIFCPPGDDLEPDWVELIEMYARTWCMAHRRRPLREARRRREREEDGSAGSGEERVE